MKKEVKVAFLRKEREFKPSPEEERLLEALREHLDVGRQNMNFNFGTESYLPGVEYIFHCREIVELGEASVKIYDVLEDLKKHIKTHRYVSSIVGNQSFCEILSLGYFLRHLTPRYGEDLREIKSISISYFPSVYPSFIAVYITTNAGYILQFNVDSHCSIVSIFESNANKRFHTHPIRVIE